MTRKHSHYYKPCPFDEVDVYRVLVMFQVFDPAIGHAVKKLLVAGGRGHKDQERDVAEAIVCLQRWQEMREEEVAAANAEQLLWNKLWEALPQEQRDTIREQFNSAMLSASMLSAKV